MTARHLLNVNRFCLSVAVAIIALPWLVMRWAPHDARGQEAALGAHATSTAFYPVDPRRVEGNDKCTDCHKSEYKAWLQTYHAIEAFDKLRTSDTAATFAKKLKIPETRLAKDSICVQCHATPQTLGRRRGVIAGVSCEACHGGAGGEDGWLNIHAVYGPVGTPREAEPPEHYQMRVDRCSQAGQNRAANAFRLARACFQCHMVWDEQLVNETDHPDGNSKSFEFTKWSTGEVRHNFHLDQHTNALFSTLWKDPLWRPDGRAGNDQERIRVMYVAGQLAQLYVGLVNRGRATDTENDEFASAMNGRIEDAAGELEAIVDEAGDVDVAPLEAAVDAANEIIDDYLEEVDQASAPMFAEAARRVEQAAEQFIQQHDGSQLAFLDPDNAGFVPEVKEDPTDEDNEAWYSDEFKKRSGISTDDE